MNLNKLKKYFKLNEKYKSNNILYEAIYNNDIDFIKNNINECDILYGGYSLLSCATSKNRIDIINLLLNDARVDPSSKLNRAIYTSVNEKNLNIFKILFNHEKVNQKEIFDDILILNIKEKNIDFIFYLLNDFDINPFSKKNDLINLCIKVNFIEAAILLINSKMYKIDPIFNNDLINSVIFKEVKLVKELLKIKDINPEKNKNEIIKYSYNHSLEEITFLLFENNNVRNNLIHDDIKLYNKLSSQIIKNKIIDF